MYLKICKTVEVGMLADDFLKILMGVTNYFLLYFVLYYSSLKVDCFFVVVQNKIFVQCVIYLWLFSRYCHWTYLFLPGRCISTAARRLQNAENS